MRKILFSKLFQNFEVVFHHNQKRPKSSREACFLYILKQKWRRSGQRFPRNPGFLENTRFHRFLSTHVFHGPRYRTWHRYLTSWFRFLTNWRNQKNWGTWLAGSQNTDSKLTSVNHNFETVIDSALIFRMSMLPKLYLSSAKIHVPECPVSIVM